MKKTEIYRHLFPMNRGLDRNSIPGTQHPASLKIAKNIVIGSTPSLKKRPGQRRLPYIGDDDGVQAATHFFGVKGGGTFGEILRVRKGKVEVLRALSGSEPQWVDLGVTVSDTDTVTFERFVNSLVIHFENTRPKLYTIGASALTDLKVLPGHELSPPLFSRRHDYRLWYGGRRAAPHTLIVSSPYDITDFTLNTGGFSMRINDGDGDPVGLTGLSQVFRGDIYAYKWQQIYRISSNGGYYGWFPITSEAGAVHHNAIAASPNDIYSVDVNGWHSLVTTDKYGGAEEVSLTRSIYDWFQENVNWSNAKNIVLVYDKPTASVLMSYAKAGSSVNNAVLGMNVFTREFFEWEDVEYPSIGKYWDFGREKTLVADNQRGICVLEKNLNTLDGDPISIEISTGLIFPMGMPKIEFQVTQAWLLCRPTDKSVTLNIFYSLDGNREVETSVDTSGDGYGSLISDGEEGGIIGTDDIGYQDMDMATIPFFCEGEGSSIRFRITHTPSETDPDESVEIYGIVMEYAYEEDTELKVTQ